MPPKSAKTIFIGPLKHCSPCRGGNFRFTALIMPALALLLMLTPCARAADRNVLVLHSYHGELAWDHAIDSGIQSVFANSPLTIDTRIEYMDTKRIHTPDYIEGLRDFYRIKYRNVTFDAIISADHDALLFLTRYRRELFPSTPVIFCGINHVDTSILLEKDIYAGIVEAHNIRETLTAAMGLHRDLRHVYIYGTDPSTFFTNLSLGESAPADFRDLLEFHFVDGLSLEETRVHARNLPENSIILQVSSMRDRNGALLPLEAFMEMLARESRVPIYGCWDYLLGHGIIGGKLISGTAQGKLGANLALGIMNGEDPGDTRSGGESPAAFKFDHGKLVKFNIDPADLPPGSIVVPPPPSFYKRHRDLILPGTGTILVLLSTIAVLVVNTVKRRRSEAALKVSHERFLTVLESIDAHIYVSDLSTYEILYMNKPMKESFGRDMTGEICWQSFRGENKPCPHCTVPMVVDEAGTPTGVHVWEDRNPITGKTYVNYDRAVKWVDGRNVKLQIATDITQLKVMDQALKKSEEKLRLIAESSVDAIWQVDLAGTLVYVSPAVRDLSGFQPEELTGNHYRSIFGRKDRPRTDKVFERAVTGREKLFVEFEVRRKDRTFLPVEVSVSPILKDGRVIGVQGVARDITERKKALTEIRQSELVATTIFESVQTGILILDPATQVVLDANPTAVRLIGGKRESIIGRNCRHFIGSGGGDSCPATDPDRRRRNSEQVLNTASNGAIPIIETVSPFLYRGKPALLESFIDIRALKESERQKEELESQLRQTQKMEAMGALAGGIAHDFNNILFPIMGYAELIMDDMPEGSPKVRMLGEIIRGAERGKELVGQILSFSRQGELEWTPMRVQTVLKEVLKLIQSTIPAHIVTHRNIDEDTGLVMADPTRVHQIAMNLITNAYHAMEEKGGELTVTLRAESLENQENRPDLPPEHVRMSIADTGPGIDPSISDRIFEPYFTTKEKGKGTGLGLSVVHGIVKNFGGEIKVESEPGKGTVFHVYLPLIPTQAEEEGPEAPAPAPRGSGHILLVDDEEPIVDMEKKMLERLGYRVTERTGSIDALAAFRANPSDFDLVITDMMMPNMTGTQLSKNLMEIREDIPIIICTGFSEQLDKYKAGAMGVRAFVMKPLLRSRIAAVIQKVLNGEEAT